MAKILSASPKNLFAGMDKKIIILILSCFIFFGAIVYLNELIKLNKPQENAPIAYKPVITTPSPFPSITQTPTPKPLTFAQMNEKYGPCVHLPTLMYHHIQPKEDALKAHQTSLTVFTDYFQNQMKYLKDKNYSVLQMKDLANFFDNGTALPKRSVLLTFDDAYADFYTQAYPILKDQSFYATVFTPTGLVGNYDYLSWEQISEMSQGGVFFANHTWSHKNVGINEAEMQKEISTADTQLSDRGLDSPKVFAYPYGIDSSRAEAYLKNLSYEVAFTTKPGSILCKSNRYDLPRVRIGNAPLSAYGF